MRCPNARSSRHSTSRWGRRQWLRETVGRSRLVGLQPSELGAQAFVFGPLGRSARLGGIPLGCGNGTGRRLGISLGCGLPQIAEIVTGCRVVET